MIWSGHVISRDVSMQTSLQLQSLLQGCSLPWTYETSREHVDILTSCIGSPGITHCSARLSFSDRKRRPPSFDLEMISIFFLQISSMFGMIESHELNHIKSYSAANSSPFGPRHSLEPFWCWGAMMRIPERPGAHAAFTMGFWGDGTISKSKFIHVI